MLHSQHLQFKRQIWKQMYLRYTGSLCVCVNLFVFWTLQTYSLFTNQRINNTHALKFSRCKPGDFLSMQASSCMAFMMEKHHSVPQLQKKPCVCTLSRFSRCLEPFLELLHCIGCQISGSQKKNVENC